jgi:hypothetical protein
VIAIEDESGLSDNLDPQREFSAGERMTIVGSDGVVQRFLKEFDVSPAETTEQSEPSSGGAPGCTTQFRGHGRRSPLSHHQNLEMTGLRTSTYAFGR